MGAELRHREDASPVPPVLSPAHPSGRDASPELWAMSLPIKSPQRGNNSAHFPTGSPAQAPRLQTPLFLDSPPLPSPPTAAIAPAWAAASPPWTLPSCSPNPGPTVAAGVPVQQAELGREALSHWGGRAGNRPHIGAISAQSGVCPCVQNVDVPGGGGEEGEAQAGSPLGPPIHFKEPPAASNSPSYG